MTLDFTTTCHAKCILAGEHSVIVGCPAIIIPVKDHKLTLNYQASQEPISCTIETTQGKITPFDLSPLLTYMQMLPETITGHFHMQLDIPLSAGLGGSAAISVALARFLAWRQIIKDEDILASAHSIENFFHGQSSGADVAAVFYQQPILYQRQQPVTFPNFSWQPHLYLSYSGKPSKTLNTVRHVLDQRDQFPEQALSNDQRMHQAVENILTSLQTTNDNDQLALGLNQAYRCFENWGLIPDELKSHCEALIDKGAIAVKPTGAGMGGYVLSLWPETPPQNLGLSLAGVKS